MLRFIVPFALFLAVGAAAKDDPVTFKSDVSMSRVDAQVLDGSGRTITGLQLHDFVLRLNGKIVPVRNLASDNMPLDVLLLIDVSGSMEPHVQRLASAAEQALSVLADKDRMAVMVFDTYTRVKLPFRSSHSDVESALHHILRTEHFNGGTRITRAMLDAVTYVEREGRPDARRAIVIMTDDETQDEEDEPRVESALARANAVLSFLQADYEVPSAVGGRPRGTWGSGGGWPGGIGFPGGGPVILGRRGPGGYGGVDPSHTAGTARIARDSGGDVMPVDEASALEETLMRLRQRYALYFYMPEGMTSSDRQNLQVDITQEARMRYQDAEIHYRRVYMSGNSADNEHSGPAEVTHAKPLTDGSEPSLPSEESTPRSGRRAAVNEDDSGPMVNSIPDDNAAQPAPAQGSQSQQQQTTQPSAPSTPPPQSGGWPRANPNNSPPQ